jgi:hypothetical protein
LIYRLNELTSKYEVYVQSMNKEKGDKEVENAGHVRLLASKLLGILLEKKLRKNYKETFSEMYMDCHLKSK